MAATPSVETASRSDKSPWMGFQGGLWQKEINVRDFIQQNYTPYEGDGTFLKSATARTRRIWDKLQAMFVEEPQRCIGCLADTRLDHCLSAGLHRPRQRDHRRAADGCATEARHPAERRLPPGGECPRGLPLRARSQGGGDLHQVSQDSQ